jgi:hypothetical protein
VIGMQRIGKGVLLTWLLLATAAAAQEPLAEDVATPASDTLEQARERDALEPRVSSADLEREVGSPDAEAGGGRALDRLDLDRTQITGNQELPKVLYIVPWQKSDPGDLMGRPVNSLLDEVLAPLDREEFVRQVDYYSDLYDVTGEEE